MAPTKKYQTEIVDNKTMYICPVCNKKLGSVQSCSYHVKTQHKTQNVDTPTSQICDAKIATPSKTVSRKEFDELKAQYQTIIEQNQTIIAMLKSMTCVNTQVLEMVKGDEEVKVVQDVQVVEQVEVVEKVEEQPKKQPKASKKTTIKPNIEEQYETARNMLLNHPYRVDEGFKSPINGEVYTRCVDLVQHIFLWQGTQAKTLGYLEKQQILKDFASLQKAYDIHKDVKVKYDKYKQNQKQKQKRDAKKQLIQPPSKEIVEKVEHVVEQSVKVEEVIEDKEEVHHDIVDIEDPKNKDVLLDCCMNLYNGGLAKAYQYLNDNKTWHIIPHCTIEKYKREVVETVIGVIRIETRKDENGQEYEYEIKGPIGTKVKYEPCEHVVKTYKEYKSEPPKPPCFVMCRDCHTCKCKANTCKLCKGCPTCKVLKKEHVDDMKQYHIELEKYNKDKYQPITFMGIRDKLMETYQTLCNVWKHHRYADYDVFDYRITWDKISMKLVNDETIDQFLYSSHATYEEIQEDEIIDDSNQTEAKPDAFLIDCCRTLESDGLAKAYHHLNDSNTFHIRPMKTMEGVQQTNTIVEVFDGTNYKVVQLEHIRNKLEHTYLKLCDAWRMYKYENEGNDFNPDDEKVFDDEKEWSDISKEMVNEGNIANFFHHSH